MQECLGRGIFGLPAHVKHAASQLRKGSSIFLYNVTDRLLFGIFEACSSTQLNMCPRAFSKNPKATSSPFPVQLQVKIALECPPLSEDDPVLQQLLSSRVGGRIGPLTFAQTQALATLLATQCQALPYMIQYTSSNNTNMTPPPIALPPRKLRNNTNNKGTGTDTNDPNTSDSNMSNNRFNYLIMTTASTLIYTWKLK